MCCLGFLRKTSRQLKDQAISPGRTTIAEVQELEKGVFCATLIRAIVAAAERCHELS